MSAQQLVSNLVQRTNPMSAAIIAQLIIALGPSAFKLIQDLIAIWDKPSLTVDEVTAICNKAQKTYDEYIAEAATNKGIQ